MSVPKITADNIQKLLNDAAKELSEDLEQEAKKEYIELLTKELMSAEAIEFTDRMNAYFAKEDLKDEDGNPIRITHPTNFSERINWDASKQDVMFIMTEEEDRWFRVDALYGNNILSRLGFKYTSR